MSESENNPETGESVASAEAAKEAARNLLGDANRDLGEIRSRGLKGFFNFDTFYFPVIARYLFL
ncbi:MAG: hypothetical protein LIP77_02950, partial [Planctomycetes bacterium]|nr:hypothetical protein [Planctomycetota bacterium]